MSEEKQKTQILTTLFESKKVHEEVAKICNRNKIHPDTFINEDIVQETFFHLSKTPADKIIAIAAQGETNLLGFASLIAIRRGVLKHSKYPDYHRQSIARHILFASNLNTCETLCVTDDVDEDDHSNFKHLLPTANETNGTEELWLMIRESLTKSDNSFLNFLLYHKKKRGMYKNSIILKREKLFNKIKIFVKENKIHINNNVTE